MKKMMVLFGLFFVIHSNAASVDTIDIQSNAMHRNIKTVVIKPNSYNDHKKFPVVYLLHGAFGSYNNWI
jgi:enterochelin esterase-like enzyme